jgi:hypothetical protein
MKQNKLLSNVCVYLMFFAVMACDLYAAQSAVDLGTAGNFVILTKSGISTTGTTSIVGDIGVSPIDSTAITGFGLSMDSSNHFATSSLVTGSVYAADYAPPTPTVMTTAISDMETAYTNAAGRSIPDYTELGAGNIGGLTLAPGLYKWGTDLIIPTDVTLSGNSTDIWIFQIAGTLDISSGKQVILSGGAQANNIFWQVAGQTTLGTTSVFKGNILDQTAIVLETGASLCGRALAQTAVTLDASTITATCGATNETTTTTLAPGTTTSTTTSTSSTTSTTSPAGTIVISEFVSAAGSSEEWIELYNKGEIDVNLTGWTIENRAAVTNTSKRIPLSGTIAALGYKILNQYTELTDGDNMISLSDDGDIIVLRDASMAIVDQVAYGDYNSPDNTTNAPAAVFTTPRSSTGRYPNGVDTGVDSADFIVFSTPTQGASNGPTTTTTTTTTTTSTTSTSGTTTTTIIPQCVMPGNDPSCGEITLQEIVDAINQWAASNFDLDDVVSLINSWADPINYLPH